METIVGYGKRACDNVIPANAKNQPLHLPHAQWARQEPAPRGTWVAYARSMQTSLGIPDLDIQDPLEGRYSKAAIEFM